MLWKRREIAKGNRPIVKVERRFVKGKKEFFITKRSGSKCRK